MYQTPSPAPQDFGDKAPLDSFLARLNGTNLGTIIEKTSALSDSFAQLKAFCQAGRVPEEAVPSLIRACQTIHALRSAELGTFIESAIRLAQSSPADEIAWKGMQRIGSILDVAPHHDAVLDTFLKICRDAESDRVVELAYRCLPSITSRSQARYFLRCVGQLPEIGRNEGNAISYLQKEISLLILYRSLNGAWTLTDPKKKNVVKNYVAAIETTAVTPEGQQERIRILATGSERNPSEIRKLLRLVSQAEIQMLALPDQLEHLALLIQPKFLQTCVPALIHLKDPEEKRALIQLMVDAQSEPNTAPDEFSRGVQHAHLKTRVDEFVEMAQELRGNGVKIEYAIVAASSAHTQLQEAFTLFDSSYDSRQGLYSLFIALDNFFERSEIPHSLRTVNFIEVLNRLTVENSAILDHPESLKKLLLCLNGKGLSPEDALRGKEQLTNMIIELSSKAELYEFLYLEERDASAYANTFQIDNAPFSLERGTEEAKVLFQAQTDSILKRAEDAHFGFWANTYLFKRTPIGGRCLFDDFAKGIGSDLYVVPNRDASRFPGSGRIIEKIDTDRIFKNEWEPEFWEKTFSDLGPLPNVITRGNIHAIDNLTRARIAEFRAFDAVSVSSNRFFDIDGEPMTLMVWNHHFDASGVQEMSLVPSRALDSFFSDKSVYYDPHADSFPQHGTSDISQHPPTLAAISARARELETNIGIINITSGSVFGGGLCNGMLPKSDPYHNWERVKYFEKQDNYLDAFGHTHKYHIMGDQVALGVLHELHQRIYEVSEALLNVRELFKYAIGLDARGFVDRHPSYIPANEERLEELGIQIGGRMAQYFCEFTEQYRALEKRDYSPVLVALPMNTWAAAAESPFVLDGTTGFCFHKWGKPFEIEIEDGMPGGNLIDWWRTHADPYFAESQNWWIAPRLVARDNFAELIKEYGG